MTIMTQKYFSGSLFKTFVYDISQNEEIFFDFFLVFFINTHPRANQEIEKNPKRSKTYDYEDAKQLK